MQIEHIPNDQLLQVSEHLLACHAAVSGENRMGAAAAYRERTAQKMPYTSVKGIISGSMVDGKIHADFRNLHIAHGSFSGDIQQAVIVLGSCF